jgi:hypothetical protein
LRCKHTTRNTRQQNQTLLNTSSHHVPSPDAEGPASAFAVKKNGREYTEDHPALAVARAVF